MADQPAARVLRDLPCSARSSTPRSLRLSATPRRALGAAHHNTLPLHGSRRRRLAVSASATEETSGGPERFYFNFIGFSFPLGPFLNRRTTRTEMRAIASDIWWDPEFFRVQFTGGAIKYDVSKCEIIFVPLCDMNHWSCFAFNLRKRLVHILDSNKTGKGEDIDTGSNHV